MGIEKALVDILIMGGVVYTMDAGRRIIRDGAVAFEGGRIVDVGPTRELDEKYLAGRFIAAAA